MNFPHNFLWGAGTSSYQIEGAVDADGRGESIWDVFARQPGKVLGGDTGAVACDHYHRFREDVALLRDLGLNAYRFSLAWPRLFPSGRGPLNPAGLAFYDRLVDALLAAGITPMATLYHWDLPSALPGGWLNRDTAAAFADYAAAAGRALGDRVRLWTTINEPWCAGLLSYHLGEHAPGERVLDHGLQASHHLLLAHGLGMQALRAAAPQAEVGIVLNLESLRPASPTPADRHALRQLDGYLNRWFLDPLHGRRYPADIVAEYQELGAWPHGGAPAWLQAGDFDLIAAPTDYLGVNYYEQAVVAAVPGAEFAPQRWRTVKDGITPQTEMGWEVRPAGLTDVLLRLHHEYQPPRLYVAENGASYSDGPDATGRIDDARRVTFLQEHIAAVGRAIAGGAPVAGYFAWSLLDNFEWAFGCSQRFGLVHVDFATQRRTPKASAYAYGAIAQRGTSD
jgi:beta-glucosidase